VIDVVYMYLDIEIKKDLMSFQEDNQQNHILLDRKKNNNSPKIIERVE